ncbi:mammalian cell entry protein, partial [Mycolicibacterium elephantis]
MSPRRRIEADEPEFFEVTPRRPRRWGLPVVATVASLVLIAMLTLSTLLLVNHEIDRRAAVKDALALGYVRQFMTEYTSLDPFHANDYVERILAEGTGEFAEMFNERKNE